LWSQQPPPTQAFPSQQGLPAPPHSWQVSLFSSQARPAAVQNEDHCPGPLQHACPAPPQEPEGPWQLPLAAQVPNMPQLPPLATHLPPAQQPPLHVELWQQGCPAAPQATTLPAAHTMPVAPAWPEATHLPPWQQPPPAQVLPAQQTSPAAPQTSHFPPWQVPPLRQAAPVATQTEETRSQHPAAQLAPAQQGWPGPPQTAQVLLPPQTRPAPQLEPAQHG
jgi:hypothetical protein